MSERMTITEALAEIKLIEKKTEKKRELVFNNVTRMTGQKDIYESDGGSQVAMAKEVQSIKDLEARQVRIREAIAKANINHEITINEETKTLYGWITWKREIAEKTIQFFQKCYVKLGNDLNRFSSNSQVPIYKDADGKPVVAEMVTNIDHADFVKKAQKYSDIKEVLDGKLSLKNATIMIEF